MAHHVADPRQHAGAPHGRRRRQLTWALLALLCLGITSAAVTPYLTQDLSELSGPAETYVDKPLAVRAAFYAHVVCGGLALLLVPVQFSAELRRRRPRLHRVLGRACLAAVGVAGAAGLVVAPVTDAGTSGWIGFSALAVLWLGCAWYAYRTAVARDLPAHREWAVRVFALTFSAVTLRLWLGVLIGVQLLAAPGPVDDGTVDRAFQNAYVIVPFLSWIPNLVVAEALVRRRRRAAGRRALPTAPSPVVRSLR